jgi:hypothetical protein
VWRRDWFSALKSVNITIHSFTVCVGIRSKLTCEAWMDKPGGGSAEGGQTVDAACGSTLVGKVSPFALQKGQFRCVKANSA